MSTDLVLKPTCYYCHSTADLYGSACKHLTLCMTCGRKLAAKQSGCRECRAPVTRLIREYNVRVCSSSDKSYFVSKFSAGLPKFSYKKKWFAQKEKLRNKPWLLEDETGCRYQGTFEGGQTATYYVLMKQGKEFVAMPVDSIYNFNKVAQYKQLTLEEAEEKMNNRKRSAADGYQRWMMKSANQNEDVDEKKGRIKTSGSDDEEADNEDAEREKGLKRKDDVELDEDIEMGDDWEHEEIFSDDDEETAIHPEEREPEIPGIKNDSNDDEYEEDQVDEENGDQGLSKSGKELKKLLGRSSGLFDSNDDADVDPALAPKKEAAIQEPAEKAASLKSLASGKRKASEEETKAVDWTSVKRVKSENVNAVAPTVAPMPPMCSIREDEVRAYIAQKGLVTGRDLQEKFRDRLRTKEDQRALFDMMRTNFRMKTIEGVKYIVVKCQD